MLAGTMVAWLCVREVKRGKMVKLSRCDFAICCGNRGLRDAPPGLASQSQTATTEDPQGCGGERGKERGKMRKGRGVLTRAGATLLPVERHLALDA